MGAYGRMVSTTSLLPVRGTVGGTLEIKRIGDATSCRSTLVADGVEFAPNPRIVLLRAQYDQLASDLSGYRTSGPFDPCGVDRVVPNRTATSVLTSFNTQTDSHGDGHGCAAVARDDRSLGLALADDARPPTSQTSCAQEAARRAGIDHRVNTGRRSERRAETAVTNGLPQGRQRRQKLFAAINAGR